MGGKKNGQELQNNSPSAADGVVSEGFASVSQAADFLSVSRAKLYGLMDTGSIPWAKFGKSRRIPWAGLKAFAAKSMVPQTA